MAMLFRSNRVGIDAAVDSVVSTVPGTVAEYQPCASKPALEISAPPATVLGASTRRHFASRQPPSGQGCKLGPS